MSRPSASTIPIIGVRHTRVERPWQRRSETSRERGSSPLSTTSLGLDYLIEQIGSRALTLEDVLEGVAHPNPQDALQEIEQEINADRCFGQASL